jgi:hypothetical protein
VTPIIAIDPGMNGGIAYVGSLGLVTTCKLPRESSGLISWYNSVSDYIMCLDEANVFLENPPLYTGTNMRGSHMAKMFGSYKFCEGYFLGRGCQVHSLVPLKWQNLVGCRNLTGLDKTRWKGKLADHARELFPGVKVTLWNADALLILAAGQKILGERA